MEEKQSYCTYIPFQNLQNKFINKTSRSLPSCTTIPLFPPSRFSPPLSFIRFRIKVVLRVLNIKRMIKPLSLSSPISSLCHDFEESVNHDIY